MVAAAALAKHGDESGVDLAKKASASGPASERKYALQVLGRAADPELARSALTAGLADPSLRFYAIPLLGGRKETWAVGLLSPMRNDTFFLYRSLAAEALAGTGLSDAIPLLIDMLTDSHISVARAAASGLKRLTGREGLYIKSNKDEPPAKADWLAWWQANKSEFPAGAQVPAPQRTPRPGSGS